VTDRDFFQNGRPVTLFGRETTLPPGAVRIARDSRAPIIPIFARRVGNVHELMIYDSYEVPKTTDIDADIDAGLAWVVGVLERAISTAPDQWVMFQAVWPSEPADLVRAFPAESPLSGEFAERSGRRCRACGRPHQRIDRPQVVGRRVGDLDPDHRADLVLPWVRRRARRPPARADGRARR
jgi:KDO2-lipid IV(A) lauroyltransferase